MSSPHIVDLPEKLTIVTVEALHEQLEPLLNEHNEVVLNAELVSRVDTAGLQVLLSFCQALQKQHVAFSWSSPPDVLREGALQLGLFNLMALPE